MLREQQRSTDSLQRMSAIQAQAEIYAQQLREKRLAEEQQKRKARMDQGQGAVVNSLTGAIMSPGGLPYAYSQAKDMIGITNNSALPQQLAGSGTPIVTTPTEYASALYNNNSNFVIPYNGAGTNVPSPTYVPGNTPLDMYSPVMNTTAVVDDMAALGVGQVGALNTTTPVAAGLAGSTGAVTGTTSGVGASLGSGVGGTFNTATGTGAGINAVAGTAGATNAATAATSAAAPAMAALSGVTAGVGGVMAGMDMAQNGANASNIMGMGSSLVGLATLALGLGPVGWIGAGALGVGSLLAGAFDW